MKSYDRTSRRLADIAGKLVSWSAFADTLRPLGTKEKGDYFEALTLHYLLLHPTYSTQLAVVWRLREVPTAVRTHLNLPDRDEGIDLVARTKDGHYWAIQCKYRDVETDSLSRRELATFTDLAFTVCRNIELALVCTTAERFSHKLKLYGKRISFLAGDVWRALDSEFFTRLKNHLTGKAIRFTPSKPRSHQTEALKDAVTYFIKDNNRRGKLIMPCGSGKSLTGWWLANKLDAKIVLVAVPSLALIRQTLQVWTREALANGRDIRWIVVCGDDTIATSESDDTTVLSQDLGVRVHTDPAEIAEWLTLQHDGTTVVFSTYQSGYSLAKAARTAGITFDLAIMDEAHKTVGRTDSLFGHLLYDDNINISRRIFMTATERRYRGQADNIVSMGDPSLYGETFHLLSFKTALESVPPILNDYCIITILVSRSEIEHLIKQNLFVRPDKGKWDDDLEAETLAVLVALRKAMGNNPIKHAVSFHSSISRALAFKRSQDAFSLAFPEFGLLDTFHVTGAIPTAKRQREIERFSSSEKSLITNARCLTEGVDIPVIDCVLFADPKKSTVDIVQAVGRALRPAPGKERGYVVIPVLLNESYVEGQPLPQSAFDSVLLVLRALASNDERIVDYFRGVSQGKRQTERGGGGGFELVIPDGMRIDSDSFIKSLELQIWSRLAKLSWRPFEDARAFVGNLGLRSYKEWIKYCDGKLEKKPRLPDDIPVAPDQLYKRTGWQSWGDWLGTNFIALYNRKYQSYEQAHKFAMGLGLKSSKEWRDFCKGFIADKGTLPPDIPANPNQVFRNNGWTTWGNWLGTGRIATYNIDYRMFSKARKFTHSLGLKSETEWRKYSKGLLPDKGLLPKDIPANPNQVYKNDGWISIGDWLGTRSICPRDRTYRTFREARKFARGLALNSNNDWRKYVRQYKHDKIKLPDDIPAKPDHVYRNDGWVAWGDWLDTENTPTRSRKYLSFEQARSFVKQLNISSIAEWQKYCKNILLNRPSKPKQIPSSPDRTYRNKGWINWGDWLGTGNIANQKKVYLAFNDARSFVQSLKLRNNKEWRSYCKGHLLDKTPLPTNIPANPAQTYKNKGWISWNDWLDTSQKTVRLL